MWVIEGIKPWPCTLRTILRHIATSSITTKWRALTTLGMKVTIFIMILIIVGIFQITINLNTVSQVEGNSLHLYSRTNKRAIKSLDDLSHIPTKELLSKQILHHRGPRSKDIYCRGLFRGDKKEIEKAKSYMANKSRVGIDDEDYINLTQNCTKFLDARDYVRAPLSTEEAQFPIAFSILSYKHVEQVERLLRAIYMPQNYYCIHMDSKASDSIKLALRSITRCFPNVFIASRLESVYWGHISIVSAEMTCLADLMKYKWKYYINLSGQMFPLQTNRNLVKILKIYNGANDIEGTYKRNRHLWMYWRHVARWRLLPWCGCLVITPLLKGSVPHNITIYKGSNQVAASRAFARYALYSRPARELLTWLSDTLAPDEYFLPSLNHNAHLHAPGGYTGDPEKKVFTARATIWQDGHDQVKWSWEKKACQGKWVRNICILGVGDLQWTFMRPELFLNKLFLDFEPLTLDCLEELMYNRTMTREESPFIPKYYKNLDFVKHREFVNGNDTV